MSEQKNDKESMSEIKSKILELLMQEGQHTEAAIASLLNTSMRTVRRAIRYLVEEDIPIVNLGNGFYLSTDHDTLDAAARKLESHGNQILIRADRLRSLKYRSRLRYMKDRWVLN